MNSNQNTKNEPSILHQNTTLNVNIDHTPDTNHINSSLIINNYSAKVTKTPDQNQINQNANSAIIITKIRIAIHNLCSLFFFFLLLNSVFLISFKPFSAFSSTF